MRPLQRSFQIRAEAFEPGVSLRPLWVPLHCSVPQGLNFVNGTDSFIILWGDLANGAHWQETGRGRGVGVPTTHPFPAGSPRWAAASGHGWPRLPHAGPGSCLDTCTSCGMIFLCHTHRFLLPLPQAEDAVHSVSLDTMEKGEEITWESLAFLQIKYPRVQGAWGKETL